MGEIVQIAFASCLVEEIIVPANLYDSQLIQCNSIKRSSLFTHLLNSKFFFFKVPVTIDRQPCPEIHSNVNVTKKPSTNN